MKIAILVSSKYAKENYIDDKMLCDALIGQGLYANIIAWDNESELKEYNIGIIRSCWDYHNRKEEFICQLEKYSKFMKIFNSVQTIKWNSDKRYLLDFDDRFKVIKTKIANNQKELSSILDDFKESCLVLKPTVSASGMDTYKVKAKNKVAVLDAAQNIFKLNKSVIIQKYISNIEKQGERSLVVIDGICTYAYKKMPAEGNFLVHNHWGGSVSPSSVTDEDKALTKKILEYLYERLNEKPLYMRIDLLYENNEPLLLELELIEPGLSLSKNEASLKLLVDAIKDRI